MISQSVFIGIHFERYLIAPKYSPCEDIVGKKIAGDEKEVAALLYRADHHYFVNVEHTFELGYTGAILNAAVHSSFLTVHHRLPRLSQEVHP